MGNLHSLYIIYTYYKHSLFICRFCIFHRRFSCCFTWSYLSNIWSCNHIHSSRYIWSRDHLHNMCYQESKVWDKNNNYNSIKLIVLATPVWIIILYFQLSSFAHSCEFQLGDCDNGTKQSRLCLHQGRRNHDTGKQCLWSRSNDACGKLN